ncbi:MAG: hypothetical protein KAR87_02160 [Candidatus Aenigmarchaeota archaeon]|nr:hypothetical protein [Candidatus Aenigmarchaeota archaeon]
MEYEILTGKKDIEDAKNTPTDCLNKEQCFDPSLKAMFKHYGGEFKLMDFVDLYVNNQDKVGVEHRLNRKDAKGNTPEIKLFNTLKYGLKDRREKHHLKLMRGNMEIKVSDGHTIAFGENIRVVGVIDKYLGFSNSNSEEALYDKKAIGDVKTEQNEKVQLFESQKDIEEAHNLIEELDKKYSGKPEYYERIVNQIQRPSELRDTILKKYGTNCKICGYGGFRKKDGSFYAETHHMIELNKQAPQTMQSWNVLVLCPLCHKKMHYAADVKSEFLGDGWKIFLDREWKIIRN